MMNLVQIKLIFCTFASQKKNMTLRELINSVDSEQYSDNQLYQKLREIKPEYGSNRHIQVKVVNGDIAITNLHVGSLGDILTYPIDVDPAPAPKRRNLA